MLGGEVKLALIHKFMQSNDRYLIDVNSGVVHAIDELVYDLLEEDNLKVKEEALELYKNKYSSEELLEAYCELEELIN